MNTTYATHASKKFNKWLHGILERIAQDIKKALGNNLVALLLGGGYGRGEGGFVTIDGQEKPYNDIDFSLVVKNKCHLSRESLSEISKKYEEEIKIHVDFSRPLTIYDIKHWPQWLMWYDLLNGHIVLAGSPDVLRIHAPERLKEPLPPIEATRLLLNRGTGILWAMRVVRGVEPMVDADFVRRNYYKCILSLGDALMILYHCYESQYRGRYGRFIRLVEKTPDVKDFKLESLYKSSLDFKFRPDKLPYTPPRKAEIKKIAQLWGSVFLHVELKRTGNNFSSLTEYTNWNGLREWEENRPDKWPRNIFRNMQTGKFSWKYPRENLFMTLPVLLGLTDTKVSRWEKESGRFLALWNKFN